MAYARVAVFVAAFHAEFAPLFGRKVARRRNEQDVCGLLALQTDRSNAENVVEATGEQRYEGIHN